MSGILSKNFYAVFKRKFSEEIDSLDFFLSDLAFELVYTPKRINVSNYPDIRDEDAIFQFSWPAIDG